MFIIIRTVMIRDLGHKTAHHFWGVPRSGYRKAARTQIFVNVRPSFLGPFEDTKYSLVVGATGLTLCDSVPLP
jgi:hypothetical protein